MSCKSMHRTTRTSKLPKERSGTSTCGATGPAGLFAAADRRAPKPEVRDAQCRGRAFRRPGRVGIILLVVAIVFVVGSMATLMLLREAFWRAIGSGAGAPSDAGMQEAGEPQLYTCGMHPNVVQSTPGDCPICHMKLTPMKAGREATADPRERRVLYWRSPMMTEFTSNAPGRDPMGHELVPVYDASGSTAVGATLTIDPSVVQNMGVRTTEVRRGPLAKTLRTVGRVDYNEPRLAYVTPKFEGWIEKLHADQTGQQVRAGDPLFDVYSPRLYNAQEELIVALRSQDRLPEHADDDMRRDAQRMVDAARVQLRYLDVTDEQIESLARDRQPRKTMTFHAAADGVITEKMAVEGLYVMPGMKLYTIADLAHVWVFLDVYEYQLPWVRVGQEATMTLPYVPGREFRGRVVYVYPYLEKETRVVKVRLDFENPDLELKPGMYATVTLHADLGREAALIPREAYIDSGTRQVAFVDQGGGKFQPREIQVGVEAGDGLVELIYGLDAGDRVVTSGQFLLDTESRLKEAVAKMAAPQPVTTTPGGDARSPVPAGEEPAGEGHARAESAKVSLPADARYACPMDTHPDETDPARRGAFFSSEPGRCDWCGMKLKPLEELPWARALRTAAGRDVAYSCPDHPHVLAEGSGTCPRCGRELAPLIVGYTCPDPQHARIVHEHEGTCEECGKTLAAFRQEWLEGNPQVVPSPPVAASAPTATDYLCPMHPDQRSTRVDAACPVCGMRLVAAGDVPRPASAPEAVRVQVNHLMEHYLALQQRFASDRTTEVALHALGLIAASDEILTQGRADAQAVPPALRDAVQRLRAAAVRTTGQDIDADRATFVVLGEAMLALIEQARPDIARYPRLYVYHCPMTKGDWIQDSETMANPFYGFKMLKCGELKSTK